jgi:hypothetical protein
MRGPAEPLAAAAATHSCVGNNNQRPAAARVLRQPVRGVDRLADALSALSVRSATKACINVLTRADPSGDIRGPLTPWLGVSSLIPDG